MIIQEVRVLKFSIGFLCHPLCSFLRGLIRYFLHQNIFIIRNIALNWKRIFIYPNPNQFLFTSWTSLIDSQRPEENSIPKIPQQKGSTQSEAGFNWKVIRGNFGFFKCLIQLHLIMLHTILTRSFEFFQKFEREFVVLSFMLSWKKFWDKE